MKFIKREWAQLLLWGLLGLYVLVKLYQHTHPAA